MLSTIAVTTDFSECARSAYGAAAFLAREHGAALFLLHEAEEPPPLYYEHASAEFSLQSYYDALAARLAEEARDPAFEGLDIRPRLLYHDGPHETVVGFVRDEKVDLLVIATHGRSGLAHVLLGSFAEKVARLSPVPVLSYRQKESGRAPFTPRAVLVPFDFSANARAVFPLVRFLDERYRPKFTFLNVFPPPDALPYARFGTPIAIEDIEAEARKLRESTEKELRETVERELEGIDAAVRACDGDAYRQIVREARAIDADLILMATHGYTGVKHFFFGSVAEKVIRRAPCPVLTVRPGEIEERPERSAAAGEATAS